MIDQNSGERGRHKKIYQKKDHKLFLPKLKKTDIVGKDWEKIDSITDEKMNSVIGNLKENQEIRDFPLTVN